MKIVLIGFMCAGKSRVGSSLSHKLGWPHLDTDRLIAEEVGMPVGAYIQKNGEQAFREQERKVINRIREMDQCVISTGGGVPLNSDNMNDLAINSEIVWLKVSPSTILLRAGDLKSRPLIDPERPLESIQKRLAEREPLYAKAHFSIDTDQFDPKEIAEEILRRVHYENS
ncbi:MAG: shikimate kinase [Elusimicrobiota bacterium]